MYGKHCSNVKALKKAIHFIQLNLRNNIRHQDDNGTDIFTRILSHLVACLSENRILKITYEESAFSEQERNHILEARDLKTRWLTATNIAICKAHKISLSQDACDIARRLPFTNRAKYSEIVRLINEELLDAVEVRNRIAHGQWIFAFTNDRKNFSQDLTNRVRSQNIVKLQLQMKLLESLADLIHDLAVSPPTYERDFDAHYKRIEEQARNLHKRTYTAYKNTLIAKHNRGIEKRRQMSVSGTRH